MVLTSRCWALLEAIIDLEIGVPFENEHCVLHLNRRGERRGLGFIGMYSRSEVGYCMIQIPAFSYVSLVHFSSEHGNYYVWTLLNYCKWLYLEETLSSFIGRPYTESQGHTIY